MTNPLGRPVSFSETIDESVLFSIERGQARTRIGIRQPLPFEGIDRWTCFELSWLDAHGVPEVGIASIEYAAASPMIVESKSLKLFLGSLNFTRFASVEDLEGTIQRALSKKLDSESVSVSVRMSHQWSEMRIVSPPGVCVDKSSLETTESFRLRAGEELVEETIHSHLLRSLCPVTAQPDWGTVAIYYRGKKLEHSSLVGYLLTHRSQQGYHEECCELLFTDLLNVCAPSMLWVGCMYTRRGGIDINPERWMPGTQRPLLEGRFARQ
jgi:7-cyano-7-deazaguanine reductase